MTSVYSMIPWISKKNKDFLACDAEVDFLNLSPEHSEVVQSLVSDRNDLQEKEERLTLQNAQLQAFGNLLKGKVSQLKKLQVHLKSQIVSLENHHHKGLKGLAKIFEGMKPQEAAQIFLTLDSHSAIHLIRQMKRAKASAILTSLPPKQAAQLTVAFVQNASMIQPMRQAER